MKNTTTHVNSSILDCIKGKHSVENGMTASRPMSTNNQQQQQQIEQNQPLKSKPGFVSYIITNK
jgi:hypothetical protein